MDNAIDLGGTILFTRGGVVAEACERQHFKVMLVQVSKESGREVKLLPLMNAGAIFAAIRERGIVFSGPAPFDATGSCMRFMFERDAQIFYAAFSAPSAT